VILRQLAAAPRNQYSIVVQHNASKLLTTSRQRRLAWSSAAVCALRVIGGTLEAQQRLGAGSSARYANAPGQQAESPNVA